MSGVLRSMSRLWCLETWVMTATGVAFTRDPATGENTFYGEYLVNAQGEDVVAGVRTPLPMTAMAKDSVFKDTYKQLVKVRERLEKKFGDVRDFEFTIEGEKLSCFRLVTRAHSLLT